MNFSGPQHAAAPNVPSRANLRSCGDVRGGSGRATSSAGEIASIDAFFRRQELLGLTAVRPYGRFQSRASCSEEPSSALPARCARDRGRLRPRRKRRVNPRSYFDADPGQSGPLSHRRAPVGGSVPHGPQSREGLHSVLIFMRRFWQQFTHGGNFKQNSGCEWISATNHICPKPELAIVGKKCCGLRQSGVSARSQSRNYFEETPFAQANGVSARGRKKANLPGNLLVA